MNVAGKKSTVMISKKRIDAFSFKPKTAKVFESSARDFIAILSLCVDSATQRDD